GSLTVATTGACHLHDMTDDVRAIVEDSDVEMGICVLHSLHTTAGLLLNESETGLRSDLARLADRLVPRDDAYRHDDMRVRTENICPEDLESPNGHAHLQHALLGAASLVVPVREGQLVLGRWQRILLVEYDRPRERTVLVQLFGMPNPL